MSEVWVDILTYPLVMYWALQTTYKLQIRKITYSYYSEDENKGIKIIHIFMDRKM